MSFGLSRGKISLLSGVLLAGLGGMARADDRVNPEPLRRNTFIFVADGLRYSAVNETDAPTMMKLRARGVEFANSHSLYPTFTMPNASAIATGHALGDTGAFGNGPMMDFVGISNSVISPLENDPVLRDVNAHFPNHNFTNETTLLAAARAAGFHTAAIGKYGPALMQDLTQNVAGTRPDTVIVDDATGTANGVPLPEYIIAALAQAHIDETTPARGANSNSGNFEVPGTTHANIDQQAYFLRVAKEIILPAFIHDAKTPIPSSSSTGRAIPMVRSTAKAITSTQNRPRRFPRRRHQRPHAQSRHQKRRQQPRGTPRLPRHDRRSPASRPKLAANTNIFITSDHGFGTISRHELGDGKTVSSFSSGKKWVRHRRHPAPARHHRWISPPVFSPSISPSI